MLELDTRPSDDTRTDKRNLRPLSPTKASAAHQTSAFLDFFAGSGLVTSALKGSFNAVWANDICPKKAAVYKANHGADHFQLGSIVDVRGADLPVATTAWASFPCQDLSLAGQVGGIHATRSGLVWQWLRVIDEMPVRPRILVAENVAGLVSTAGGDHYRTLHRALQERGFVVGAMLVDAALWVPQSRPRIFVVAVDARDAIPDELLSTQSNWLHTDAVRNAARGLDNYLWWNLPSPSQRRNSLSDLIEWDAPYSDAHIEQRDLGLIAPRHAALLAALPDNQRIAFPGYKRTRNGKQVLERRFDGLAGCLRTPGGGSSRQLLVTRHHGKLRSRLLTVRETARLMGAPDTFKIPGSYNDGYGAMGDAVALPVARWLSEKLLTPLANSHATQH